MDKKPLPEIGKKYHFFDDGKTGPSRHYIAEILELIPFSEFGNVKYEDMLGEGKAEELRSAIKEKLKELAYPGWNKDRTLLDVWKGEVDECDWLYAPETDYAVKASIPEYDENPIIFVRDLKGGWFSMDTVSGWQSGRLDIDGTIFDMAYKEAFPEFHEQHKNDI